MFTLGTVDPFAGGRGNREGEGTERRVPKLTGKGFGRRSRASAPSQRDLPSEAPVLKAATTFGAITGLS